MFPNRWLLYGGFIVATCVQLAPALDVEILIPLYEFPNTMTGMWFDLQNAAQNGHPITGIMNPNSGPNSVNTAFYLDILANFTNNGDGANAPGIIPPTLICYVATGFGNTTVRPKQVVLDDMEDYQTLFPGVCDGIFFDEAAASGMTDPTSGALTETGQLYKDYNDAAFAMNMTSTFNPGLGADPVYYGWEGAPTVMSFENFYESVKTVGMPRAPSSAASSPSQHAMMVHSATELESDDSLVDAMVEKAACAGWGKIFLTGTPFLPNPWSENTVFWDALVAKVSQPVTVTCPEAAESPMGMMVPLLPNPVPDEPELDAMIGLILPKLSKSDYGDVVYVVLDPSDSAMGAKAGELRDAGARVFCYVDSAAFDDPNELMDSYSGINSNASDACGGFYVDNFDTSAMSEAIINDFFITAQFAVPRGTIVFRPVSDDPDVNDYLYTNDWDKLSFQVGRVIVATVVDGAATDVIPPAGGDWVGSAVIMTSFTGNTNNPVECPVADMAAASYGYAYVTDAADFSALPSYWDDLFEAVTDPSSSSNNTCDSTPSPITLAPIVPPTPEPSSPPTISPSVPPTPEPSSPMTLSPSAAPTTELSSPETLSPSVPPTTEPSLPETMSPSVAPTPEPSSPLTLSPSAPSTTLPPTSSTLAPSVPPAVQPTTAPVQVTACGTEPEATIRWSSNSRRVIVKKGGCADMSRISEYLMTQGVTDALSQVATGVWELDATITIQADSTLTIAGQGMGECDELRMMSNSPRSRIFGIGGSIVIQNTQIFGWKDGEVDVFDSTDRGYILCRSCKNGSSDQCVMSVTDSTIGHLGSEGDATGGLAWTDLCETPAIASVQDSRIINNYRGLYAEGVDLEIDNVWVSGSENEGIRLRSCSGHIASSIVIQPLWRWAIRAQRSDGIEITDNTLQGSKGMFLASSDSPKITGNMVDTSRTSVRIETTNTTYLGNTGDGVYTPFTTTTGVQVNNDGCFAPPPASGSTDAAVEAYILSNLCTP